MATSILERLWRNLVFHTSLVGRYDDFSPQTSHGTIVVHFSQRNENRGWHNACTWMFTTALILNQKLGTTWTSFRRERMMTSNNRASFVTNSNLENSQEQYGQSQKVPYCGSIFITLKKSLWKEGNRLVITRNEGECQHKGSLRVHLYADRTIHIHIVMSPKICTNDWST